MPHVRVVTPAALTRQPRPDDDRGALRQEIAPAPWDCSPARRSSSWGPTPAAFLQGARTAADLIGKPSVFSVIVAVPAGIVGVLSLTEARANALSTQRAIWRGRRPKRRDHLQRVMTRPRSPPRMAW